VAGRRVRLAPSPTGAAHVGTARTALFNWLLARQDPDGVYLVRIEDTDASRNEEQWVDNIVESLEWLQLAPDEPAYRQSEHTDEHQAAIGLLEAAGHLYRCDCTAEEIAARKPPSAPPGYDGFCRDRHVPPGPHAAWRFRTPDDGQTIVVDDIRGDVTFANALIDDFVVARSNGDALFAVANAVDDRRDRITHVVRGEEHLPNTPKQILLWHALDGVTGVKLSVPHFAHLPILVDEQRRKLSKRRDPLSIERYRTEGYLSEAFVNFLALLGWNPRGTEEKVALATCVEQFSLADVSHSPAFFDEKKLAHLNGQYIRDLSVSGFIDACRPWVDPVAGEWSSPDAPPWSPDQFRAPTFAAIAPAVQERVTKLSDVPAMVDFFFLDEAPIDDDSFAKTMKDPFAHRVLEQFNERLSSVAWTGSDLHELLNEISAELSWPLRKVQAPVRLALTGRLVGPPLFESMEIIGRDVMRERVARARERAAQ
jgi:glutamyl-tRNA synthetase